MIGNRAGETDASSVGAPLIRDTFCKIHGEHMEKTIVAASTVLLVSVVLLSCVAPQVQKERPYGSERPLYVSVQPHQQLRSAGSFADRQIVPEL